MPDSLGSYRMLKRPIVNCTKEQPHNTMQFYYCDGLHHHLLIFLSSLTKSAALCSTVIDYIIQFWLDSMQVELAQT